MERLNPDRKMEHTGQTVGDFWAWGFSDVLTNIGRAVLAEWIVGSALGAVDGIRPAWEYYDLDYDEAKIEVKSSAYLQSWKSVNTSRRGFSITPTGANLPVDPANKSGKYWYDEEKKRRADVYVFCFYAEEDPERADPLDVRRWEFYVLSTPELERHYGTQKSVSLSRIQAVCAL